MKSRGRPPKEKWIVTVTDTDTNTITESWGPFKDEMEANGFAGQYFDDHGGEGKGLDISVVKMLAPKTGYDGGNHCQVCKNQLKVTGE